VTPVGSVIAVSSGFPVEAITSADVVLVPLTVEDAGEMAEVLGAAGLYEFIGGRPLGVDQLRARYAALAVGRSPDGQEDWFNWIVRRPEDGRAVGTVQATLTQQGRQAHIAWMIGLPWQGRGYASRATRAMVGWLEAHGTVLVVAHIHPAHTASIRVARAVGLTPTDEYADGERRWTRVLTPSADPSRAASPGGG